MPSQLSVTIDPAAVLGVGPEASLQEIRDAYRAKAKRYHPDAGGEEWAFRVLVTAYETLCAERVDRAADREWHAPPRPHRAPAGSSPPPPPPPPPPPRREPPPRPSASEGKGRESVRPGVQEAAAEPSLVVDVEKLAIRFQPEHVWLISEHGGENRVLSCSLNVNWPDPKLEVAPETIVGHETILGNLQTGFDAVAAETEAETSRWSVVDGRFSGWLGYPSNERAARAFDKLSRMLHMVGLSVHMWSRDLTIPRQQGSSGRRGG